MDYFSSLWQRQAERFRHGSTWSFHESTDSDRAGNRAGQRSFGMYLDHVQPSARAPAGPWASTFQAPGPRICAPSSGPQRDLDGRCSPMLGCGGWIWRPCRNWRLRSATRSTGSLPSAWCPR